jgi:hypothetical protein
MSGDPFVRKFNDFLYEIGIACGYYINTRESPFPGFKVTAIGN